MKTKLLFILFILFTLPLSAQNETQEEDSMVVVTLTNSETRIGTILSDDGREILLMTKDIGKIYIRKENIKSIVPYDPKNFKIVDGEFRDVGPFTTRYHFTTNSLPIKKGENYAMINLYGPEVHFALSDRFSLGVMSTWTASPFVLAAKFTIPTKNPKLNFGLGTLAGTSGYLNTFRGFGGLHWGMVTYGDRMNNITFSAGFSYIKTGMKREYVEYQPGIYPAKPYEFGGGYYFAYPTATYKSVENPIATAPIIGLGGIAKVGKKASFIWDAMVMFGSQTKENINQEINDVYDPVTGQPSFTEVKDKVSASSTDQTTIAFFMPGMRFQTKDTRAFQIALAGALVKTETRTFAFPAPMVSWFFKF
jgi:hypothetical protein